MELAAAPPRPLPSRCLRPRPAPARRLQPRDRRRGRRLDRKRGRLPPGWLLPHDRRADVPPDPGPRGLLTQPLRPHDGPVRKCLRPPLPRPSPPLARRPVLPNRRTPGPHSHPRTQEMTGERIPFPAPSSREKAPLDFGPWTLDFGLWTRVSVRRRRGAQTRGGPFVGAIVANLAVEQPDDPVGVRGDVLLVRDEDDRVAARVQVIEEGHDLRSRLRVQVSRRLVG